VASVALATALLCLIAGVRLAEGLLAIGTTQQLDYAEPIVYGQAARLVHGEALYQPLDRPPYTVTAYTPLYYYAAAALQATLGSGFGPGRALSLLAGLTAAAIVGHLSARAARSLAAGLFGGLTFLGLGFTGSTPWFALYRVDMLGITLSLGSIWLLSLAASSWQLVLAGALAGLALLTKQTCVAAALAGGIWLWGRSRRAALLFVTSALVVAGLPCLAFELSSHAFVANTVLANINPLTLGQLGFLQFPFESSLGLPLVLAAMYVLARPPSLVPWDRLLMVYWPLSALPLLGLVKLGGFYNYWIELAASTAILSTAAIRSAPAL
jgi:hypothetical protein